MREIAPLFDLLAANMRHQDQKYGPFTNTVAGMRLGLAVAADELEEALQAWRTERRLDNWLETHIELIQAAAVICRILMQTGLPEASAAWEQA